MKILVAEDEKRMNRALCEILRLEKYEVDGVSDGEAALEAIESGVYDVIVLDVMMPKRNGFDVAREVRRRGVKTPILMLTARAETTSRSPSTWENCSRGSARSAADRSTRRTAA